MGKKKTREEVLVEFNTLKVSESYDLVEYINSNNVILKCKTSNFLFKITLTSLRDGSIPDIRSCLDKTNFTIYNFKQIHGDQYTYEKYVYTRGHSKSIITCKLHGDFKQTPVQHNRGRGCKECGHLKTNQKTTYGRDKIIKQFRNVHGEKYCYKKFEYVKGTTKSVITCKIHGDFEQTANTRKSGNGCKECGLLTITEKKTLKQETVINQFIEKHGDRYDYSKFVYNGNDVKGIIICKKHGEFEQLPYTHKGGAGCNKCGRKNTINSRKVSQVYIIKRFRKKHGNKYDYQKFVYVKSKTKGIIICKEHGEFTQSADHHARGKGCPTCTRTKTWIEKCLQNPNSKPKCYLIECHVNEKVSFFKVGVTYQPKICNRFKVCNKKSEIPYEYTIIDYVEVDNPRFIFGLEQLLLNEYRTKKMVYIDSKKWNGSGECFKLECGDRLVEFFHSINKLDDNLLTLDYIRDHMSL